MQNIPTGNNTSRFGISISTFNEFKRDAKIKALENRNLIGPSHIDKLSKEVLD